MIDESYGSSVASKKREDTRETDDELTSKIEENRNLRSTIDRCIAIMTTDKDKAQAWDFINFASKDNPNEVKITKLIALSIDIPHILKSSEKQQLFSHLSDNNITKIMLNHYLWFDYYECRQELIIQQPESKQIIYVEYDDLKCESAIKNFSDSIDKLTNDVLEVIHIKDSSPLDESLLDSTLDNLRKVIEKINNIIHLLSRPPNPHIIKQHDPRQNPFEYYHDYVWKLLSYLQNPDIINDAIKKYSLLIDILMKNITKFKQNEIGVKLQPFSELRDIEFYINCFDYSKVKLKKTFSDIEAICTRISQTSKYGKSDDLTEDIRSIEDIIDIMNQNISECVFGIALEPKDFYKSINLTSVKLGLFANTFSKNLTERNLLSGDYSKFLLKINELVTIFQNIIFFAKPIKKQTLETAKGPGGRGGKTRKQKRNRKLRKSYHKSK